MQKHVEVDRDLYSARSVQGRLAIDGTPQCFTLEPPEKTDGSKPRAIPCGTYALTVRWSWHFKQHVPHVEAVPGFDAIEQHIGNGPGDTDACTLVGKERGPQTDFIAHSLVAFTALMAKYLDGAELTNPNSPEQNHIWKIGTITYRDVRDQEKT